MAESMEKNREIDEEKSSSNRRRSATPLVVGDITSVIPLNFPDNKYIDPYDPTTFGYTPLGSITAAHGVHGWVRVQSVSMTSNSSSSSTAAPSMISRTSLTQSGAQLHLKPPKKRAPRSIHLVSGKYCANNEFLCLLEGIETREDALKLRGAALFVRQEEEEKIKRQQESFEGEESYFVSELVGLKVYQYDQSKPNDETARNRHAETTLIGTVSGVVFSEDISDLPLGYDMLEIAINRESSLIGSDRGGKIEDRVLIPLVPQLVPSIDIGAAAVYIDPPTGLLDLRYVREEKVRVKGFLPPASSST